MQITTYEKPYRDTIINDVRIQSDYTEVVLGLLPMSHIYGLVVICHANVYRGDGVVVLPKFEFPSTLQAIQDYKINSLFLVSRSAFESNCADQVGPTDHYFDGQEQAPTRQVRSQLRVVNLHWRCTVGERDGRGSLEDLSYLEDTTRIRSYRDMHRCFLVVSR